MAATQHRYRRVGSALRAGAVVAVVVLLGACNGGGDDGGSQAGTTASTATSSTASTSGPSTPPADVAAVTGAFVAFFDGANPDVEARLAHLEHADELRQMLIDASTNPQFQQLSTQVRSVELLDAAGCTAAGVSSPCARVVHDVLLGTMPVVPAKTSYAVQVDGVWKVSAKAWCDLVAIGGETCPAL